jgi:hypothetical protein
MISSTIRKVGPFSGTGLVSTYPFSFKVFTASDLKVVQADSEGVETVLTLNSAYTASVNANQDSNPGGSITLTTALPTGSSLIITSAIAQTQGVQVTDLGGFYPAVLNALHDRITILTQQLQEQIDRCVKYSITDPALLATLPAVPTRKGMLLGFDPTSGDAVAVAGAVNPSSGPFLGNLVGNVTSTGVSSFKRVNGLRYLEGYGAVCDGSTDDSTALAAAIADVAATGSILVIPAGKTCSFSTPQVITSGNFGIVGGAGAKLKYTGAGIAITIDGHLLTNGARNVVLRDFAIDAPTATTALKTLKVTSSMFSNLSVRGCTGTAFIFDFAVSNLYEHLNCSVNDGAFTATPTGGILLTNAGGGSSNNTFINPRIEGINGDGIVFQATQANTIYGGTTEANIGRGLYLSGACALNTFIGMDIEANGGTPEVQVGDGTNACRHTKFTNTTVQNQITISNNAKETTIDGGSYLTIVINAGALATTITNGVQYGTLTDNGTATQRFSENAATPNTLGATNFKGAATFTASPVFPNDIPLQAVPSTGGLLNLLWLTAADQSLLQYVATKAMKVRNSSSVTQLTVDDAGTTVAGTLVAQAGVNLNTKPWISQTAPTIASGFGTSPSITANNGTAVILVNVGTGGTASSGVITMPTISGVTGWTCFVENITAHAAHRADDTVQTASTAGSITIENQTKSTGAAVAWTASDIVRIIAFAY